MRKNYVFILCLLVVMALVGCGNKKTESNNPIENGSEIGNVTDIPENSDKDKNDISPVPDKEQNGTVEEPDKDNNTGDNTGNEAALSDKDIEAAKKVAMSYYTGTVFEVKAMTYVPFGTNVNAEGECNFLVKVSKDGKVQEVERMIQLNRKGESWEVVNEGY